MSSSSSSVTYDQFGIRQIHPSLIGGQSYFMNHNATTLTELQDGGKFVGWPTGTIKTPDDPHAWRIPASGNFARPHIVTGISWTNYEITSTVRIIDATHTSASKVVQMYGNGEHHSSNPEQYWMGSANKGRLWFNGDASYIKELYHEPNNTGYTPDTKRTPVPGLGGGFQTDGRWITWKFMSRNKENAPNYRRNEVWVDPTSTPNANNWVKVLVYEDIGNLYASAGFTNFMNNMRTNYPSYVPKNRDTGQEMKQNEIIRWAGGWITFRSDYVTYDIKNVSARELRPIPVV